MTITSVRDIPLEELQKMAEDHPEQWGTVYVKERTRRSVDYQAWLKAQGLEDTDTHVDYFQEHE
jgi:hypothetical protein